MTRYIVVTKTPTPAYLMDGGAAFTPDLDKAKRHEFMTEACLAIVQLPRLGVALEILPVVGTEAA